MLRHSFILFSKKQVKFEKCTEILWEMKENHENLAKNSKKYETRVNWLMVIEEEKPNPPN